MLGEHTALILHDVLGMTDTQISRLVEEGAIGVPN